MTIGSGIAVCGIWAGIAVIAWPVDTLGGMLLVLLAALLATQEVARR